GYSSPGMPCSSSRISSPLSSREPASQTTQWSMRFRHEARQARSPPTSPATVIARQIVGRSWRVMSSARSRGANAAAAAGTAPCSAPHELHVAVRVGLRDREDRVPALLELRRAREGEAGPLKNRLGAHHRRLQVPLVLDGLLDRALDRI